MKHKTFVIALALASASASADGYEPSAGEVIGDVVIAGGQEMANGVAITSHATADSLDNISWAGCKMARWAVGDRRDRTPSIGNTIVGLIFRLPVTLISGGTCAVSALVSIPAEGVAYASDVLAGRDTISPHEANTRQYARHQPEDK